jgi:hypothetical protein
LQFPSLGSLVAHQHQRGGAMPPYVAIPNDGVGGGGNGAGPGFLSGAYSAFNVGNDPSRVRDLNPPEGVSFARSDERREMLHRMDALSREVEEGPATRNRDAFFEQAYGLIASPQAKAAFDLSRETPATRARYGGQGKIGAGCLLARRLVEAGSRFVTVVDTGWDTHQQIARELPRRSSPTCGNAACWNPRWSCSWANSVVHPN